MPGLRQRAGEGKASTAGKMTTSHPLLRAGLSLLQGNSRSRHGVATGRLPGAPRRPGSSHCVHSCFELNALTFAPVISCQNCSGGFLWFGTEALLELDNRLPEQDELGACLPSGRDPVPGNVPWDLPCQPSARLDSPVHWPGQTAISHFSVRRECPVKGWMAPVASCKRSA